MSCNCCISPAMVASLVRDALFSEMSAGHLQAPLKACDGTALGAAKVPTCDEVTLAINEAIQRVQPVIHDTTLSGYGTCQSPLTVNTSWLTAFIQNLADTTSLIHIDPNGGISGDGTEGNPLTLSIFHDDTIDGVGTKASPLGVDESWLNTQIKNYVDANGVHTADGGGIAGNGSISEPLALDINHDDSIDGDGTKASPLGVDTKWLTGQMASHGASVTPGGGIDGDGSTSSPLSLDVQHDDSLDGKGTSDDPLKVDTAWLADQITDGDVLKPDGTGLSAADVTEDGTLPTTIIGGTDMVLGTPEGYVNIGNGFIIPLYKSKAKAGA